MVSWPRYVESETEDEQIVLVSKLLHCLTPPLQLSLVLSKSSLFKAVVIYLMLLTLCYGSSGHTFPLIFMGHLISN